MTKTLLFGGRLIWRPRLKLTLCESANDPWRPLIYDLEYSAADVVQEWTTGIIKGEEAEEVHEDQDEFFRISRSTDEPKIVDSSKSQTDLFNAREEGDNDEDVLENETAENAEEELYGDFEDVEDEDDAAEKDKAESTVLITLRSVLLTRNERKSCGAI
ncbi:hypothetical protein MRB53_039220 [Persea americana]|nr:hypothetical protein MRB53_039220 [Persea americana]